jgi:hypothetical protein
VSHECDLEGKFLAALGEMDAQRARRVQEAGCAHCGGALDRADYPRKPRGELGEAADAYARRFSLCCRVEGCRRRATPPSLRFLGRKVYFAALVVIASAIGRDTQLVGRGRAREVKGVPVRTVRRWLVWWQTAFALSAFWAEAKALFAVPVAVERLPASLLERIAGNDTLGRTLALLAPITTTSVRARIERVV